MLPEKTFQQDVSNLMSIAELKQSFIEHLDKADELSVANLRFFCLGKELQDELYLYSYDL